MKRKIKISIIVCAFLANITLNARAQTQVKIASPLQTGHYQPGLINIRDFADPAPISGLVLMDYNIWQNGNKYFDRFGNQVKTINGSLGQSLTLNPSVNGYVNAPYLLFIAKNKFLGATYFAGISVPYTTVNLNLAYQRIGIIDSSHQSGNVGGGVNGITDLSIMPLFLSWGSDQIDFTFGYTIYAPTGKYTTGAPDNIGLGFWSNVFQAFAYIYPMKIDGKPSKALAIMFAPTLEITGKLKDVDVHPGNRFSIDYGIDQYLSDKLSLGIYGGNNWQIGDDTGFNVYWDGTVKDKIGVIGGQLGYWIFAGKLQVLAKYGVNYGAVQRIQQNIFQINATWLTGALTGNKAHKNSTGK